MSLIFLACALFGLGVYGILVRRDIVAVLASIEVMMGGALVLLVGLGSAARQGTADAVGAAVSVEGIALMIVIVAAAEAAVGLALLVAIARRRGIARIDELTEVKG